MTLTVPSTLGEALKKPVLTHAAGMAKERLK